MEAGQTSIWLHCVTTQQTTFFWTGGFRQVWDDTEEKMELEGEEVRAVKEEDHHLPCY
jgi:hypothetical protein